MPSFRTVFTSAALAYLGVLLLLGPLLTNDGPVHLAAAHVVEQLRDPAFPLQAAAYEATHGLQPNVLGHWLLQLGSELAGRAAAEAGVQLLCLLLPALAGWWVLHEARAPQSWMAWLLLPLSTHQLFFLGLYNFCLSMAGVLASLAVWLRWQRSGRVAELITLAALLGLTALAHAGGAALALVSLGGHALGGALTGRERGAGSRLRMFAPLAVASLPTLVLLAVQAARTAEAPVVYGPAPIWRVSAIVQGSYLQVATRADRVFATLFLLGVWIALLSGTVRTWTEHRGRRVSAEATQQRLAWLGALGAIGLFALALPDVSGGGWTHFSRAAVFVPMMAVLTAAVLGMDVRLGRTVAVLALACWIVVLAGPLSVQWAARPYAKAIARVDETVGEHCTVLPVVFHNAFRSLERPGVRLRYAPLYQVANWLEARHDRVVLFNFLARLGVYPVRWKEGKEPQALLYGWRPRQQTSTISMLRVDHYRERSGLAVDYLLVIGKPDAHTPELNATVAALAGTGRPVYEDAHVPVRLTRLPGQHGSLCRDPRSLQARPSGGAQEHSSAAERPQNR